MAAGFGGMQERRPQGRRDVSGLHRGLLVSSQAAGRLVRARARGLIQERRSLASPLPRGFPHGPIAHTGPSSPPGPLASKLQAPCQEHPSRPLSSARGGSRRKVSGTGNKPLGGALHHSTTLTTLTTLVGKTPAHRSRSSSSTSTTRDMGHTQEHEDMGNFSRHSTPRCRAAQGRSCRSSNSPA